MSVRLEYSTNNSGGYWWLSDDDWRALEAAGWDVVWGGKYFCRSSFNSPPAGKPAPCAVAEDCTGHAKAESAEEAEDHRFLGSLAREAYKDFPTAAEGIREWEKVVGQSASDEGCNCCGPPHNFSWDGPEGSEWVSGNDVVSILYPGAPMSLRDAAEELAARNTTED